MSDTKKGGLVWKDEYSVNVKEIDDQHKQLFVIVNNLIEIIQTIPNEEAVRSIVNDLVAYKRMHFATEDKYFKAFNFEGTIDHQAAHADFDKKITALQEQYKDDVMKLAWELVDLLENWFINHIMYTDHAYTKCFNDHGLY